MSGRVFDKDGSPLVAVRVNYNDNKTINEAATDRLGVFRIKDLPEGPLLLGLRRNDQFFDLMRVPAGAVEIDVIVPE